MGARVTENFGVSIFDTYMRGTPWGTYFKNKINAIYDIYRQKSPSRSSPQVFIKPAKIMGGIKGIFKKKKLA